MGEETKIEWTDHSWSPWMGCTKVSPGCANCYAETLSKRNPAVLGQWGRGKPRVLAKNWNEPARWNKAGHVCGQCGKSTHGDTCFHGQCKGTTHRPTIFPSLCDWLDDEVDIDWLARFLQLIHDTPNLRWLLLTKRPEQFMPRMERAAGVLGKLGEDGDKSASEVWGWVFDWIKGHPPLDVWVGTSVEDQARADQRIPALLQIPAVGRFLSVEPLLGPVDLQLEADPPRMPSLQVGHRPDWVIIGGESGHGARPCNVDWIRSLVRQCKDASVPCFVKQLGAYACFDVGSGFMSQRFQKHPKGGDPAEWPEDLRVREFPEGLR